MTMLYIHIPFCEKKCGYCAFASVAGARELYRPYCTALLEELSRLPRRQLSTLFFGGGTPTSLPADLLCELLDFIRQHFSFAEGAEISMEANPGTVSFESLRRLRMAGVNRISFGVQSFDDDELRTLGRIHNAEEAREAVRMARDAGFNNFSLDLMYGLPDQDAQAFGFSLRCALELHPHHISLYQLTPEEGTPLFTALREGRLTLPGEEDILNMDSLVNKVTGEAGFEHYETSNYALPGYRCRHNIRYWRNEEWFAAGAAAVSFVQGCRERREESPRCYIKKITAGEDAVVERESLDLEASFRETVIMGLRMMEGVELSELWRRFHLEPRQYYGGLLQKLMDQGLVERTPTHLRLSSAGHPLANMVMAELV